MNFNDLSEEEKHVIIVRRGQLATGYNHHTDQYGRHYFWPMGRQPIGAELNEIAAPTVPEAAEKFLTVYLPRVTTDISGSGPKRRPAPTVKTIGYRRYYRKGNPGQIGMDTVWETGNPEAVRERGDFVRWIDLTWQYDEIEVQP